MKALALFSGGLDSMLAIKLITNQNIQVIAININIGFGATKDKFKLMNKRANLAGASFEMIDARDEYLKKILFSPKYGYGKHFNPCIDCHGFMFFYAKKLLEKYNASFLITGEVLGQRPMSQRIDALKKVSSLAQDEENLILRPLCAKLLEPSKPELLGWVQREKLLDISGRSRKKQLLLAKEFNFDDYESPGGGCLLTNESFATKIKDFIKYDKFSTEDIELLKFGRHFRLPNGAKLVLGRNEEDNQNLQNLKLSKFSELNLNGLIGPFALLSNNANHDDLNLACQITLSYAKTKQESYDLSFLQQTITQKPCDKSYAREFFIYN